ncbi:1437_t:CDS:2, partial [Funneliformis mosseae]
VKLLAHFRTVSRLGVELLVRCSLRMLYPSVAYFGTVSWLGVKLLTWKLNKNKSNFFECLENLKKIRNDKTLQLVQIKSEETIQLVEIKNFKKCLLDFDYDSDSSIDEAENLEDETFDLNKFTFDGGETVSKSTLNRKIDLRVLTTKGDIELSHSEFTRKVTPVKIIKDRSKCLRTNKCILDTYLLRNLSEEAVENSTFYGIQSASLER